MASTVSATRPRPPSARSSRATIVSTAWSSASRSTASATRSGSVSSTAPGFRVSTRQNPQARGAALAEHHERRRAVGPAVGQVGAAGLLAHGDEAEFPHGALQRQHLGPVVHLRPEPLGLARGDLETTDDAGLLQASVQVLSAVMNDGARALASRERRQVARPVPPRHVLALGHTAAPGGAARAEYVDHVPHADREPLGLERRHRLAHDAARDDVAEHRQVGRDVEGEPVHGPAPAEPDADRGDFARMVAVGIDPDTEGSTQPAGAGQAEIGHGVDEHLLDRVHVRHVSARPLPEPRLGGRLTTG